MANLTFGARMVFQAEIVQSTLDKLFITMYFINDNGLIKEVSLKPQHTFTEALEVLYKHLKEHPFG